MGEIQDIQEIIKMVAEELGVALESIPINLLDKCKSLEEAVRKVKEVYYYGISVKTKNIDKKSMVC